MIAHVNAIQCDGWTVLAANAAAEAAQTAAEAAVIAATAAAQAATAATMSRLDMGLGSSHMGLTCGVYGGGYAAPLPFPTRRMAVRPDASWRKEWNGRHRQDGYMGTVRSRSYKRQTGGSASKSRRANSKHRHHAKAQHTGDATGGQGLGGGRVKDGQPRREPRRWYRPQQPKGNRSHQKQVRLQAGKSAVNRATQTASEQGTQTVSPYGSKDVAFSAAEELPEIFMLTGRDSEDDEAAFFPGSLPGGPKDRWPQLLDGATTISSASSADNLSQEDSDEDNTMNEEFVIPDLIAVEV